MLSPSVAIEALTYANRIASAAPVQATRPPAAAALDFEYHDLLREICKHEGEVVENPPLLFKLTVALGCAMTAAGVVGLGLGLAHLLERLF